MAGILLKSGHFEDALNFGNQLFGAKEDWAHELAFRLAAMRTSKFIGDDQLQILGNYLRARLQIEIDRGDVTDTGIAHYNLGNHFRSIRKYSWAVHHYKLAGNLAPFYLKQSYYYKELASALFEGGRYKMATVFYKQALSFDNSEATRALYADALMFSGHYEKALNQFDAYLAATDDPDPEWVLKEHALDCLIKNFGIKVQARKSIEASLSVICDGNRSDKDRNTSYEKAIGLDALCSLAWFNSGVTNSELGKGLDNSRWRDAAYSFLIAALSQPNDITAWSNAALCAFNHKDTLGLLPLIVMCAYSISGDRFLSQLNEFIFNQPGSGSKTDLIDLIEKIALEAKSRNNRDIVVRLIDDSEPVVVWNSGHE